MNTLILSQEALDSNLPGAADGDVGDFTIKGGTLKIVPGVGAVVSFDTIAKIGGGAPAAETDDMDEGAMGGMSGMGKMRGKMPMMSPGAAAVVKRRGSPAKAVATY